MRDWPQRWIFFTIVVGLCLTASRGGAETCTLVPKKVEAAERGYRFNSPTPDWLFAMTGQQNFMAQFVPKVAVKEGKEITTWEALGGDPGVAQFKKLVKREPVKYNAACPFRGVAKLGDREYAFVLDAAEAGAQNYGLLYFDRNGNGDLTDDGVLESIQTVAAREAKKKAEEEKAKAKEDEAKSPEPGKPADEKSNDATGRQTVNRVLTARGGRGVGVASTGRTSAFHSFPPVDLKIEVDGKQTDYRFFLTVYGVLRKDFAYARASLSSGIYYEGQIELDGRKQQAVLVDYNSNGRFDDKTAINEVRRDAKGPARLYPAPGDVLYLDPKPVRSFAALRDAGLDFRHNVEKLISVAGRYYDVKVSAAGDALSIAPSEVPLGAVTNPGTTYTAVLRGELGTIRIKGKKDAPVAVPAGQWTLLAATIELPEAKPAKTEKSDEEKAADKQKNELDAALAAATAKKDEMQVRRIRLTQAMLARDQNTPKTSLASAMGTTAGEPVNVVAGETALLPFGPPYKPSVSASAYQPPVDSLRLNLAIYGSGGEVITGLRVNGKQPPVPHVKILDPSGEVANEGDFHYG